MNFFKHPGLFEFILIGFFAGAYVLYLTRIIWIAIVLKTKFRGVFLKIPIRFAYFSLFIIALMAPSFGDFKKEIKAVGKDIYILVDLSQSMNTRDVQPSRLEKLKFELKNLVNTFHSDRIGLIVFSSDAFVQCPITYDHDVLMLFIEGLNTQLLHQGGTDFGPELQLATESHINSDKDGGNKSAKLVLLISDGEDFGDDTDDALDELQDQGIKLFTLGIGTQEGGKIPLPNGGIKFDEDGEPVISKLNSSDLKRLAANTGGKYYEINADRNDTKKLLQDISNIEGEVREMKTIDASANKYFYFLFAALVLVVFDILVTVHVIRL